MRHAVDRPRQLAQLCARHAGAFDADLSRYLVVPVRGALRDEAAVAGRARSSAGRPTSKATAKSVANGVLLTTSHDGYLPRFGVVHRRVLMVAHDGSRLDGEDTLSPAPGARIKGRETDYALRFHLHPSVKASRLSDARGVMLVLPNRDVWTFEALDDKVELEDSVFLAGNDGPRRTSQIVIRQDSQHAPSDPLEFCRARRLRPRQRRHGATPAASRNCRCRKWHERIDRTLPL